MPVREQQVTCGTRAVVVSEDLQLSWRVMCASVTLWTTQRPVACVKCFCHGVCGVDVMLALPINHNNCVCMACISCFSRSCTSCWCFVVRHAAKAYACIAHLLT